MDDDDDFGDFGGFETADPGEAQEAAAVPHGITATPSPWAVYTAAAVQGVVDPGALTPSTDGEELVTSVTPSGDGPALPDMAVPKLDATTLQATRPGELGTGTGTRAGDSVNIGTPVPEMPWPTVNEEGIPSTETLTDETGTSTSTASVPVSPRAPLAVEACQVTDAQAAYASLHAVQAHRDSLVKDLERMSGNQAQWNRELAECKKQLEHQVERYDQLQIVHSNAVADMRKAGHDALAVIVAEYQELSKTTMARQKEASQRELLMGLEEHNSRWQQHAKQQEELTKAALEEMKSKMAEQLTDALNTQREQLQEELQRALKEEREKHNADLQQALEAQREASKAAFLVALHSEREKLQEVAKDEKVKLQALLEEERLRSAAAIRTALEEEQSRCQDCMDVALAEERRHSERHAQQMMEEAQRKMRAYVHEQQQADMAVRLHALTTMDLFLEGTRKQLDVLMNQPPPKQPAPTPTPPPDTLTPRL